MSGTSDLMEVCASSMNLLLRM